MAETWPWLTLALLGGYHGLNPAMGWLFAVALGLQEGRRSAVLRALGPIALGHAASVAVVVALVGVAQVLVAPLALRLGGAAALALFGLYKLLAPVSHPRWVGMRVGARDLTIWSFLMSAAHGAGLMLVPVLARLPGGAQEHAGHAAAPAAAAAAPALAEVGAVAVHTAGMFVVMALVAVVVFEKLGLAVLRRAWLNLDRLWAAALIGAGALTLVL
jgi:hypothetical protein